MNNKPKSCTFIVFTKKENISSLLITAKNYAISNISLVFVLKQNVVQIYNSNPEMKD